VVQRVCGHVGLKTPDLEFLHHYLDTEGTGAITPLAIARFVGCTVSGTVSKKELLNEIYLTESPKEAKKGQQRPTTPGIDGIGGYVSGLRAFKKHKKYTYFNPNWKPTISSPKARETRGDVFFEVASSAFAEGLERAKEVGRMCQEGAGREMFLAERLDPGFCLGDEASRRELGAQMAYEVSYDPDKDPLKLEVDDSKPQKASSSKDLEEQGYGMRRHSVPSPHFASENPEHRPLLAFRRELPRPRTAASYAAVVATPPTVEEEVLLAAPNRRLDHWSDSRAHHPLDRAGINTHKSRLADPVHPDEGDVGPGWNRTMPWHVRESLAGKAEVLTSSHRNRLILN